MRKTFIILLLILSLFSMSCAKRVDATKQVTAAMESWMGADVNDLIAKWGPPQHETSDSKGGRILTWDFDHSFTTPGRATTIDFGSTTTTVYTPPTTSHTTSTRSFWITAEGKIYHWAWRGL